TRYYGDFQEFRKIKVYGVQIYPYQTSFRMPISEYTVSRSKISRTGHFTETSEFPNANIPKSNFLNYNKNFGHGCLHTWATFKTIRYIRIRKYVYSTWYIVTFGISEFGKLDVKWMFLAIREIRFQEIGVRVIGYFGKRSSSGNCRSENMTSGKGIFGKLAFGQLWYNPNL
ncbi:20162_t:CDS:2, partial [Funneliformis geosporum]